MSNWPVLGTAIFNRIIAPQTLMTKSTVGDGTLEDRNVGLKCTKASMELSVHLLPETATLTLILLVTKNVIKLV